MAKYYIQSGDYRLVVQANNARGAALWAVHRALSQVLTFDDDSALPQPAAANSGPSEGRLGETIRVHEQGFDRADAHSYETFELIHQWNLLMKAIDRLQQQIQAPVSTPTSAS